MEPSVNGSNGTLHDQNGKFAKGNPGGPGNPHAKRVLAFRSAMYEAVTDEDVQNVFRKLLSMALDGNIAAIREFHDRLVGKPAQTHMISTELSAEEAAAELRAVVDGMDFRSRKLPPG